MKKQYWHLAVTGLLCFGSFAGVLFAAKFHLGEVDVLMVVFCAGTVGAVVNNYFRISGISKNLTAVAGELDSSSVTIQLYVSPLMSGILGFVAYGLFVTGLLKGTLFPVFSHIDDSYENIASLLQSVSPMQNIDAAKAIVWAFIAGFFERFIPNVLGRLSDQAQKEK